MIHIDSSFAVDLLRETGRTEPGPATSLLQRLQEEQFSMSFHVVCELYAGAALAPDSHIERERVERLCSLIPIIYPDERFGPAYGDLLAWLQRRGERMGTMDLLIATAAVIDKVPLVTRNRRDFSRVPGLQLLDY